MKISTEIIKVDKIVPLKISRGVSSTTTFVLVKIQHEGLEGLGEATPFSLNSTVDASVDATLNDVQRLAEAVVDCSPYDRQQIFNLADQLEISSSVRAAYDMAMYDWLGKKCGLPLWKMWGLSPARIQRTSLTIGIMAPEEGLNRLELWRKIVPVHQLKVKLGSPEGIEADKALVAALRGKEASIPLMVDANGGWSLSDAISMSAWLKEQGVLYIEQPLAEIDDSLLPELSKHSALPIFVDESCKSAQDITRLSGCIAGINIKQMKCGGLTNALGLIATARASGLKVMVGCYGETSLAITAMAHLTPLVDYVDLDSHLNLKGDPFEGAAYVDGRIVPSEGNGLGVVRRSNVFV
jgi:L-Ala-D/L-Glu epimerase